MKSTRRIGAAVAALALASTLAACSGGQSVADACKIAEDTMTEVVATSQTDAQAAMQSAMEGEDVDLAEIFAPVVKALEETEGKVTNGDVKPALSAFVKEYKSFAGALGDFDMSAFKDISELSNIDPTAPDAEEKLAELQKMSEELQAQSEELQTTLTTQQETLTAAGTKLQEVCNAG